ncbi:hypothetical protein JCM3774_001828 [Rhodotorula dairenensis]
MFTDAIADLNAPWNSDVSGVIALDPPELARLGFLRAFWQLRLDEATFGNFARDCARYTRAIAVLNEFGNACAQLYSLWPIGRSDARIVLEAILAECHDFGPEESDLLLDVWEMSEAARRFFDREVDGPTWTEAIRLSHGPGPRQDLHARFVRPQNPVDLTVAFDYSVAGALHLSADGSVPKDPGRREPLRPFTVDVLNEVTATLEKAILDAVPRKSRRSRREPEKVDETRSKMIPAKRGAQGSPTDGGAPARKRRRSTAPAAMAERNGSDAAPESDELVLSKLPAKRKRASSSRSRAEPKAKRRGTASAKKSTRTGRAKQKSASSDRVQVKSVMPQILCIVRVGRTPPMALASRHLALLVVVNEESRDKDRGVFAHQYDAEQIAKAVAGVPQTSTKPNDPTRIRILAPSANIDFAVAHPGDVRQDGTYRIQLSYMHPNGSDRIPVELAIVYRDTAGAAELVTTSSDSYLQSIVIDAASGWKDNRVYHLSAAGLRVQDGSSGRDEFRLVPTPSEDDLFAALQISKPSRLRRLADLSEATHLSVAGAYLSSSSFRASGWARGGAHGRPGISAQPQRVPGILHAWKASAMTQAKGKKKKKKKKEEEEEKSPPASVPPQTPLVSPVQQRNTNVATPRRSVLSTVSSTRGSTKSLAAAAGRLSLTAPSPSRSDRSTVAGVMFSAPSSTISYPTNASDKAPSRPALAQGRIWGWSVAPTARAFHGRRTTTALSGASTGSADAQVLPPPLSKSSVGTARTASAGSGDEAPPGESNESNATEGVPQDRRENGSKEIRAQIASGDVRRPDVSRLAPDEIDYGDAVAVVSQLLAELERVDATPPISANLTLVDALTLFPGEWVTTGVVVYGALWALAEAEKRMSGPRKKVWIDTSATREIVLSIGAQEDVLVMADKAGRQGQLDRRHWKATVVVDPGGIISTRDTQDRPARILTVDSMYGATTPSSSRKEEQRRREIEDTIAFLERTRAATSPTGSHDNINTRVRVEPRTFSPQQENGFDCGLFAAVVPAAFARDSGGATASLLEGREADPVRYDRLWGALDPGALRSQLLAEGAEVAAERIRAEG